MPRGAEKVSLADIGEDAITAEDQEKLFGDPYNPEADRDDPGDKDPRGSFSEEKERLGWEMNEGAGDGKVYEEFPLPDDTYAQYERGKVAKREQIRPRNLPPTLVKTGQKKMDRILGQSTDSHGSSGRKRNVGSKPDRTKIMDKVDPRVHGKEDDHEI